MKNRLRFNHFIFSLPNTLLHTRIYNDFEGRRKTHKGLFLSFSFGLTILFLCSFSNFTNRNSIRYYLGQNSKLEVFGKTNINEFCCASYEKFEPQKLTYEIPPEGETIKFDNANLNIQINEMDCGGRLINNDFRKTLNAEKCPFIQIELKEAINQDCDNLTECDNWIFFIAATDITINQVKKRVSIPIHILKKSEQELKITGQKELHLSNFNITPPTALMGMIKVKNSIEINFDLEVILN
jgi:hypothetical protein